MQHRAADNPATLGTARDSPSRQGQIFVRARIITAEILEEALVRATAEPQRLGERVGRLSRPAAPWQSAARRGGQA